MESRVLAIVLRCTSLGENGLEVSPETDLWAAGMSSIQSVKVMLAVEDEFGIELPEKVLTRSTFSSVSRLSQAVRSQLTEGADVTA